MQASEIGINLGIGIRYENGSDETWVMTFLSAPATPIARGFEIWVPNAENDALILLASDCDQDVTRATDEQSAEIGKARIGKGDGTIGQAWRSGVPAIRASDSNGSSATGRSAAAAGQHAMLALPVMNEHGLKAVVAWYL